MAPRIKAIAAVGAAALLVAGIALAGQVFPGPPPPASARPALGLFTSLPIFWAETDGMAEALDGGGRGHWAKEALETDSHLVPIDTLDDGELAKLERLIMAQPRPLAPAENVALDDWVRAGGRLLLFADPFLTQHSRFQLGDKRRPQDMVVLSPILRRWGLELRFDDEQPQGVREITFGGAALPVDLAGTFARVAPGAQAECNLSAVDVIATCRIGKGSAVIVADASVLDPESDSRAALSALTKAAFAR